MQEGITINIPQPILNRNAMIALTMKESFGWLLLGLYTKQFFV